MELDDLKSFKGALMGFFRRAIADQELHNTGDHYGAKENARLFKVRYLVINAPPSHLMIT